MPRNQDDMASAKEFQARCEQFGAKIKRLRISMKLTQRELGARLSIGGDAVGKIEMGIGGAKQFVKLADIASTLNTTPNFLLGIRETPERSAFKGLLQAAFVARGIPLEQARPLAEAALRVLDSPEIRSNDISPEDTARTIGVWAIRQLLPQEPE